MSALFKSPLFESVKQEKPDVFSRVVSVTGNIEEDLLGLKFENLVQALSGKRNAVPKAHASLDDFLRKAMTWNIKKKLRELDEAYEGERG